MTCKSVFLGNESISYTGQRSADISDEEYIGYIEESNDHFHEIKKISEESDRLFDICNSMEDIVNIAKGIGSDAKLHDLCMLESATEVALAGSECTVEEALPGLESYSKNPEDGIQVAVESIGQMIKNIWETILRYLRKLWARVKKFFAAIFKAIPRLKKANDNMRKRAVSVEDKTADDSEFELGRTANVMSISGNVVASGKVLHSTLDDYIKITTKLLLDYSKQLVNIGNDVTSKITAITEKVPYSELNNVNEKAFQFQNYVTTNTPTGNDGGAKADADRDPRYSNLNVEYGLMLLQSRLLIIHGGENNVTEPDRTTEPEARAQSDARATQSFRLSIVAHTTSNENDALDSGEMKIITPSEMKSIADSNDTILTAIEKYMGGKTFKDIEKVTDKMEKATSRKAKAMEKLKEGDAHTEVNWRLISNFNKMWKDNWSSSIQAQWQRHCMTVVRGAIDACNKSASKYS